MKNNNAKKVDPFPVQHDEPNKDALDSFRLFYEALPFAPSYSERIVPRLRRPSRPRS
jgi:hypothetical protein